MEISQRDNKHEVWLGATSQRNVIVTSCVPGIMVIQMKNQSVDIKVLIHQNIQCINILAQAPEQFVALLLIACRRSHTYVCMTMSRTKIIHNQFYNC